MGKSEARPKDYGGGDVGGSGSPGKIFVGGLPRDTTLATFQKHFGNYGDIVDSVIMKNKQTSQPRGFGFITYSDPAVVDKVMEDTHVINGKHGNEGGIHRPWMSPSSSKQNPARRPHYACPCCRWRVCLTCITEATYGA